MSESELPDIGRLLAPFVARVPPGAVPRLLARLERQAAARYRGWATELPAHAEVLLACAADEDEIADQVESAVALAPADASAVEAPVPDAVAAYHRELAPLGAWDQLRVQARAERSGADAWRRLARQLDDRAVAATFEHCARLEEASAERLDALIARHG